MRARALEAGARGRIVRRVRDILADLRRPLPESTGKNAGRPRAQLEEHLETLEREGVFATWGYVEADGKNADALLGAGYKKSESWLELSLFVVLAPEAIHPRLTVAILGPRRLGVAKSPDPTG
jgi:hypothetical protein